MDSSFQNCSKSEQARGRKVWRNEEERSANNGTYNTKYWSLILNSQAWSEWN
jgi:hypothetical protein